MESAGSGAEHGSALQRVQLRRKGIVVPLRRPIQAARHTDLNQVRVRYNDRLPAPKRTARDQAVSAQPACASGSGAQQARRAGQHLPAAQAAQGGSAFAR